MSVPRPDPRYLALGEGYADAVAPARFPAHRLRWRNDRAAAAVGLTGLDDDAWIDRFARFAPLPDNLPEPLALRYHGHQFRHYNPHLGDGRGFLYAQFRDDRGRLLDLGTKGSGTTPWSRGGDGRLTLKGAVRELLASEMLEALGVDTCRTLSIVETGESLDRHDEPSPTRAAVLVRLSHSHVRVGTFQRLAAHGDRQRMARLVAYVAEHLLPHATPTPRGILAASCDRAAWTCGAWMAAGFVHGVLNTDNQNLTGESFDYGPWRFTPTYDPSFVAAYFDHEGLYAFGRQAEAVHWNLRALAQSLALLGEPLDGALDGFAAAFHAGLRTTFLRRLGVASAGEAGDTTLCMLGLEALARTRAPLVAFFDAWHGGADARPGDHPDAATWASPAFDLFREVHSEYVSVATPPGTSPDLHIDTVEALWAPIAAHDDWAPLHAHVAGIRALGARLGPATPYAGLDESVTGGVAGGCPPAPGE
ncbi:MAG: hypothetical protein RLZZ299_447 [Pseudomonadota bacterium]|jgi:uncharacterized protein YdiU (UPF0061 family)